MTGVLIVVNQSQVRNLEGTAEFRDGERADFHVSSEHVIPASEFNRQRELAQLAQEAGLAAEVGYQPELGQVIDINEQVHDFFLGVGNNLHTFREEELRRAA